MSNVNSTFRGSGSYPTLSTDEIVKNIYNSASAVPSMSLTPIVTYLVPAGKKFFLGFIQCSGENTARYQVQLDTDVIDVKRTYWGGGMNVEFEFTDDVHKGLEVASGVTISVKVYHDRPYTGNFDAKILGVEKG
jgi:hypothetical protein